MHLNEFKTKFKKKKRVGRGSGSGMGKTSCRGHKGQKSRSGYSKKLLFEGGQTPLHIRLPKFGFKNSKKKYIKSIKLNDIKTNKVSLQNLKEAKIVKKYIKEVKILYSENKNMNLIIEDNKNIKISKKALNVIKK